MNDLKQLLENFKLDPEKYREDFFAAFPMLAPRYKLRVSFYSRALYGTPKVGDIVTLTFRNGRFIFIHPSTLRFPITANEYRNRPQLFEQLGFTEGYGPHTTFIVLQVAEALGLTVEQLGVICNSYPDGVVPFTTSDFIDLGFNETNGKYHHKSLPYYIKRLSNPQDL